MSQAWNLSSSKLHGWLECVDFPVYKIKIIYEIILGNSG